MKASCHEEPYSSQEEKFIYYSTHVQQSRDLQPNSKLLRLN